MAAGSGLAETSAFGAIRFGRLRRICGARRLRTCHHYKACKRKITGSSGQVKARCGGITTLSQVLGGYPFHYDQGNWIQEGPWVLLTFYPWVCESPGVCGCRHVWVKY